MRLERAATIVLGLYLVGTAAYHLAAGDWTYLDYLRLQVPVPFAALTGAVLLFLGIFRWHWVAGRRDNDGPHSP